MTRYCDVAPGNPVHKSYHATEYGFPTHDERALFERLALEIMQAGLSWHIVLAKRAPMNEAFDKFKVDKVANYKAEDIARLLKDEGIIRNNLKIKAIIENAKRVQKLRKTHKGFAGWIASHHPLTKAEWVKVFKKQFLFTGGEITGEFLMSIGYLPDVHWPTCPVYKTIAKKKPPWMNAIKAGFDYGKVGTKAAN